MVYSIQDYIQKPAAVAVTTRWIGGLQVIGYSFQDNGNDSRGEFVVSPKKTLESLVESAGEKTIGADVAENLVMSAGLNPGYVARYLPGEEFLSFMLEIAHPTAQD